MENSVILLGKSPELVERTGGLSELTLASRRLMGQLTAKQ
jgi:hypothetical protein